jgi:hypothetical protein
MAMGESRCTCRRIENPGFGGAVGIIRAIGKSLKVTKEGLTRFAKGPDERYVFRDKSEFGPTVAGQLNPLSLNFSKGRDH